MAGAEFDRRPTLMRLLTALKRSPPFATSDPEAIGIQTSKFIGEWSGAARTQRISKARRLLRQVLVGRLVFTPVERPPDLPQRKGAGPEGAPRVRGQR